MLCRLLKDFSRLLADRLGVGFFPYREIEVEENYMARILLGHIDFAHCPVVRVYGYL